LKRKVSFLVRPGQTLDYCLGLARSALLLDTRACVLVQPHAMHTNCLLPAPAADMFLIHRGEASHGIESSYR
jgi:hypothetical protein